MKFTRTEPCKKCPFLKSMAHAFTIPRLKEFASNGLFPCHLTAKVDESKEDAGYEATAKSVVCAGMLIFNEKRKKPNQMMRICERLRQYDYRKLKMDSPVR